MARRVAARAHGKSDRTCDLGVLDRGFDRHMGVEWDRRAAPCPSGALVCTTGGGALEVHGLYPDSVGSSETFVTRMWANRGRAALRNEKDDAAGPPRC